MANPPLTTRPPSETDTLLQQKFDEVIVNQAELMDKLAQQLLTLELAIPGLYATVLKLIGGETATVAADSTLVITFSCWGGALALTLFGLMPRRWKVDREIMRQDPAYVHEVLGIEDFFEQTARYKWRLLLVASILFFSGTVSAAYSLM